MNLSLPDFTLPDTAGLGGIRDFQKLTTRLETLAGAVGTRSHWFRMRCTEILEGRRQGKTIARLVREPRDSRVVLHLWEHDRSFLDTTPPTKVTLSKLKDLAGGFRASHLTSLIEVYFRHFDQLANLTAVAEIISDSLEKIPKKRLPLNLRQVRSSAGIIFHAQAPKRVANKARRNPKDFKQIVKSLGVPVERPGRFMQACKNEYYVQTAQDLKPGQAHHLFKEIVAQEVKESPYDSQVNLGQKIAAIMIDKCERLPEGMPESWLDTVISIMGDPRRGQRSQAYQKWWTPMSAKHISLVRKWLAGADLRLFLELLEDSSNDSDLQRMYPDRKAFLEGLLEHYDVQDARLFLGESAAKYIARKFSKDAVRAHGQLRDRHKTVIHLQVGGIHLFEGTHNYAARIGRHLSDSHSLLSHAKHTFSYQELTSELEFELLKAARGKGRGSGSAKVVHSTPLTWQNKLISEFRRLGLNVHPEHVLTAKQYKTYRQRYGLGG